MVDSGGGIYFPMNPHGGSIMMSLLGYFDTNPAASVTSDTF
jgi:hypothetical protein